MAANAPEPLHVPDDFSRSYAAFKSYPANLLQQRSYPEALVAHAERLKNAGPTLFIRNETEVEVPIRDYAGSAWDRTNIHTENKLRLRLGDTLTVDPSTQTETGQCVTRKDPTCRYVFIPAEDSRSSLKITNSMFLRLLSYHQVMPSYLDFVTVFGSQSEPRDLRFSGFREQMSLANDRRGPEITDLGRSGRQYQLCYNLKGVTCKSTAHIPVEKEQWSVRQAAIHHQFDVETGTTLWITIKGNLDLKTRVAEMAGPGGKPEFQAFGNAVESFRSSLAVHLLFCHWSTEGWRWYIQHLEVKILQETHLVVYGPRGERENEQLYTANHLQSLQYAEEQTSDAIMDLGTNCDVLASLSKFYEQLLGNPAFPLATSCGRHICEFVVQIEDMIYDFRMQIARAKNLVEKASNRKQLLLQHLQSQSTNTMERLTKRMDIMTALTQKEAIAMRIVTVVTLVYLPATFVSTFFSTDVVKYQDKPGGGSYSSVAMMRWLEVTLPLTLVTLVCGYSFFKREEKRTMALMSSALSVQGLDSDSTSCLGV